MHGGGQFCKGILELQNASLPGELPQPPSPPPPPGAGMRALTLQDQGSRLQTQGQPASNPLSPSGLRPLQLGRPGAGGGRTAIVEGSTQTCSGPGGPAVARGRGQAEKTNPSGSGSAGPPRPGSPPLTSGPGSPISPTACQHHAPTAAAAAVPDAAVTTSLSARAARPALRERPRS